METLNPFRSKYLLCFLMLILFISTAAALAAEPPTRPFPRIESGQHTAPIRRIGVDAQGRWLVTASDDKTARVWDLGTGKLVRVLRPPIGEHDEGKLSAAAMSTDGRTIAVGGWTAWEWDRKASIYLFDRETGSLTKRISGLPQVIYHLAFSSDGKRLAAALGGHGIRIFSTDTWAEIGQAPDYGNDSYWIAFDSQGRLASTSWDGFIRLYDRELNLIAKKKALGGARPFALAFSPDGKRIAVGFNDTTAVNVLSGENLNLLYTPDTAIADNGGLNTVAWSRDGQTLFAGGRYNDYRGHPLLSWPEAGRGPVREWVISKSTIMDLVPLADGRLIFGSQDPAWGLLDQSGERILGVGQTTADFRRTSDKMRLSSDATLIEVDFSVLDAQNRWADHVMRFDLSERRMTLDGESETAQLQRKLLAMGFAPGPPDGIMGPTTRRALENFQRDKGLAVTGEMNSQTRKGLGLPSLTGPRTEASQMKITDWHYNEKPKLNGKALDLEEFETSLRLDIAPDSQRFLLGTHWYLRLYDRAGTLVWKTPAPATTWMVKLSENGRWAVAAFGDGSIRWFDAVKGHERLALFVDGGAIAGQNSSKGKPSSTPTRVPWVLWTPDGFFDAAVNGDQLMGWHMNRGADEAGELVDAAQIGEVFRRPDLVAQALQNDYPQLAQAALSEIGDLKQLLTQSRPPGLERMGPQEVSQSGRTFEVRFQVEDRGGGVGRIEYRVNGVVVGQGDFRGHFGLGLPKRLEESRPFTLEAGRSHRIEARAYDARGKLASTPVVWEVEISGKVKKPALYGLAVGIASYKDNTLNLEFGDDDAVSFVKTLQQATGSLFHQVAVKPLVNQEASLAGITEAFEAVAARAGPEDVFVLFLAGHGLVVEGRYHFIPYDLIYRNRKALEDGSLNEDRLRDLLAKVQAQKSLVVIDSCYAGAALGDRFQLAALTRGESLEERAAIDRLMAKTGRATLASSTHRQFALEGLEGHGVFTYVLLEGLRGRADILGNADGMIDTRELAAYLEDEVPLISQRVWQYEQHPMHDLRGQSFPIGLRRKAP